jgi:putative transposase
MRYQFIEDYRDMFPIHLMCRVLTVSRSGYYAWRIRPVSQREMANCELIKKIKAVHEDSWETYGSPRVYQELKAQGISCGENRVARLMQSHGIRAKQVKRKKMTTKANAAHPVAPNLLNGNFTAERPDEKWLADISYIPTAEGWLYLAVIMDLFTRLIVGWSMAARMTSPLVEAALEMALQQRQPPPGLLHHSDRGSQYTGKDYQILLKSNIIEVSMSSTGNCYDNAPIESLFGTLKTELVHHRAYRTREEAKSDIFFYIEGFYNRRRRHSALGYLCPVDFELVHQQQSMLAYCPLN